MLLATLLAFGAQTAPTEYRITYSEVTPRVVTVTAQFTLTDSVLQMYSYGGEHIPDGWRTFVRNERLETMSGQAVRMERLPERRWKVFAPAGERVRLRYDVAIEHDRDTWIPDAREAAYARDWGVFAVGRALFIYDDASAKNIDISFELPPNWRAATAWQPTSANTYRVETWRDAIQSIVFAGVFSSFEIAEGATRVSFSIGGPGFEAARPLLEEVTRSALQSFTAVFGGSPPARLHIVINPDSSVMGGGGGVFRQSISMTFGSPPTRETLYGWGHTISHELFHIWNATAIQPAGPGEEWLLEGNADYYSVLTMTRLGYFPVPLMLAKVSGAIASYNRVAKSLSLEGAGRQEFQGDGPAMLYNGGWTAALALDLAIRRATSDTKSFDNVMRDIYRRLGNSNVRLSNAELQATSSRVAGLDFTDFFRRHVEGTERIPIGQYLTHIGAEVVDGSLRLIDQPTPRQLVSRAAYFGPKAIFDGLVPEPATRGHDPDVMGGRFNPVGRYEVRIVRPEGDMPLEIVIAGTEGKLAAIVTGPGGSFVADKVSTAGTRIVVAFTTHGAVVTLDMNVAIEGVQGTWSIAANSGKITGKKLRR